MIEGIIVIKTTRGACTNQKKQASPSLAKFLFNSWCTERVFPYKNLSKRSRTLQNTTCQQLVVGVQVLNLQEPCTTKYNLKDKLNIGTRTLVTSENGKQ